MSDDDGVFPTEEGEILDAESSPSFYNPNGDELVEKSKQKTIEELLTPKRVFPSEKPWLKSPTPVKEVKLEENPEPITKPAQPITPEVAQDPEHDELSDTNRQNVASDELHTTSESTAVEPLESPLEITEEPTTDFHDEDPADIIEGYHEDPEELHQDVPRDDPGLPSEAVMREEIPADENESIHNEDHDSDKHDVEAQNLNDQIDVATEESVVENDPPATHEDNEEHTEDREHHDEVSAIHETQQEDHETLTNEEHNTSDPDEIHSEDHVATHDGLTEPEEHTEDRHETEVTESPKEQKHEEPLTPHEDEPVENTHDEETIESPKEEKHEENHNENPTDIPHEEAHHKDEPPKEEVKQEKVPVATAKIAKPAASKLAKPKASAVPKISTTKTTAATKPKISAPSPRTVTSTAASKKAEKPATATTAAKKSTTATATKPAVKKAEPKPKAEPPKPKTAAKPKEATKVEPTATKPKTPRAVATSATKVAPKAEKPKTPRTATPSVTATTKASTTTATATKVATTAVKPKEATKTATAKKAETTAAKAEKPKTPRATPTSTATSKATSTTAAKPFASGTTATTTTATKPKLTPVTLPTTAATKTAPKPATVKTPRTATATATKEKPATTTTSTKAEKPAVTTTKAEKPVAKPVASAKPKETKPAPAKAATKAEKPAATSGKPAAPKATAKKAEKASVNNTNAKNSTATAPAKVAKTTATKAAAKKTSGSSATKTKAAPAKGGKNSPAKAAAQKTSGADGKVKANNSNSKASGATAVTTATAAHGAVPKPGLTTARKPTGAQNRRKPTVNPIQGMKSLEQHTQQNKSDAPPGTPHKRMIQLRHVATPTSKEKLATFSLYKIQGRKILMPEKVELKFQSLHVSCAFVLDTKDKIFIWFGPDANRMEKAFAVDFAKRLKDEDNMGRSQTFTIGECKEDIEDEFWNYLSPNGEIPAHEEKKDVKPVIHLYRVKDQIEKVEGEKFMKEVLNDLFCFVMDCPNEVYCWTGKNTSDDVRAKATEHAKALLAKKKLKWVKVEKLLSGVPEPVSFKVKFANWGGRLPIATGPAPMPAAKKRIPLVKFDVNKLYNRPKKAQEVLADDGSGRILMWIVRRSENNEKVPLAKKDYGHFFSGESYLILYTYTIKNTEHKMIYFWQGRNSTVMDKGFSAVLTIDLDDKLGGEAKQIRVVQGKEPQHFLKIFGGLIVVHKGKYNVEENYLNRTKLYHLKGSFELGILLEVEPRLRSVNVNETLLLTTPLKTYFMHSPYSGISFNAEKLAWCKDTELIEFSSDELNDDFVDVLGLAGSGEKMHSETYPWLYSEKEESNSHQESWPVLYQAQILTGQFKIEEIFDFTQDDLIDRDVFILDCKDTIWVWFGKNSVPILQQLTLETLLDYVDKHPMGERLGDPINIIKSGFEPLDFTVHFFGWEYPKNSNPQSFSTNIRPMEEVLELIKKKYTYEELIKNTPEYCDKSKLELYMSDEEFERIFAMTKEEFENLSDWKRIELKKQKQLF